MGVNGIYGLSGSGLDVESMVKAGMLTKQNKYDKMYKEATKQEWVKEAYVGVYNMLTDFQSTMSNFKMSSKLNTMLATSTNSAVSVTANASAVPMNHTIEVKDVASNAYLMSASAITRNGSSQTSNTLANSLFKNLTANNDGTYTVVKEKNLNEVFDSSRITDNGDGTSKAALSDGSFIVINNSDIAGDGSYTANGTFDVKKTVNGNDTALSFDIADGNGMGTVSFTYADLADGKTFNDLATKIKNQGLNISASYDSTYDTFALFNSQSGADNKISFKMADNDAGENAATLLSNLNLKQSKDGSLIDSALTFAADGEYKGITGSNAKVVIDGREYGDLSSNYIQIAGVSYTFTDKTKEGEAARVAVSQDTEAIVSNMQEFVDSYNSLIDELNNLIDEESFSDYGPLTDKEREEMTESQITAWEKKAKSGLLNNSRILRNVVSSMRECLYTRVDSVDSKYNSASAIGITSSDNKGHLTLDTDKLKKALADDPDCVYQLFASDDDTWDNLTDKQKASGSYNYLRKDSFAKTGIANRLYYTAMANGMSSIKEYAGTSSDIDDQTTLGKTITTLKDRMNTFKATMDAYQKKLYDKYDNLEVMIQRLSIQLSTVTSYGQ